ncbi:hypothetical protein [Nocardioides euryhalodurans]|uniref:Uncharacterized protein n=1 Tax=Nocardioides euryhalodurans TaxID=2518370 RepID=A0A4P7GN09_9ACTN|nr:hypothetical protein [Nocardioides euryhalodurans]QBR93423.1 hypothetical protein EXE57_14955 [Nocardioides euryhalodurans]
MNLRVLGLVAGLLGGLCWAVRWGVELAGSSPSWGDTAQLAGLVLIGLALAVVGAGLVSRSALWLRVIVAVAFPLLVWSVYLVVKGDADGVTLDGVLGALAVVGSAVLLATGRRSDPAPRGGRHGSHASR